MSALESLLARIYADGFTEDDVVIAIEKNLTTPEERAKTEQWKRFQAYQAAKNFNFMLSQQSSSYLGTCESTRRRHETVHYERHSCVNWKQWLSMDPVEVPPNPFESE